MCFPKAPDPVAPIIPPTPQQAPDAAVMEARKNAQARKGFGAAATDVTGTGAGLSSSAITKGKTLLGQ